MCRVVTPGKWSGAPRTSVHLKVLDLPHGSGLADEGSFKGSFHSSVKGLL